eukprot:GILJ01008613.1.p1 GENE.GILJ01008613.1~~GILJ01008613.1.p1  ORF type:complete len:198 (-),score=23.06 GILJ01008613.1:849-1442(-)
MSFHSGSNVLFGQTRQRLYKVLKDRYTNDSVVDLYITVDETYHRNKLLYSSIKLNGLDVEDHDVYLDFISQGWFILNLSGLHGSQPFRVQDACVTDTAIVSDHIYVDSIRNGLPLYSIPVDVQRGSINETALATAMDILARDHLKIYRDLIPLQRAWCHMYFSKVGFIHQILRHVPQQRFAAGLRQLDSLLYASYYG